MKAAWKLILTAIRALLGMVDARLCRLEPVIAKHGETLSEHVETLSKHEKTLSEHEKSIMQADWAETNANSYAYIENKPKTGTTSDCTNYTVSGTQYSQVVSVRGSLAYNCPFYAATSTNGYSSFIRTAYAAKQLCSVETSSVKLDKTSSLYGPALVMSLSYNNPRLFMFSADGSIYTTTVTNGSSLPDSWNKLETLPAVSADDNGKILKVVDGIWAAADPG